MWLFRHATRRAWRRPRLCSFATSRLVLRGSGSIFRRWMWTSICRRSWKDFWGRGLGWRRGWGVLEENRAARRNYLLLEGTASLGVDRRRSVIAMTRGTGKNYYRRDAEGAEKGENINTEKTEGNRRTQRKQEQGRAEPRLIGGGFGGCYSRFCCGA